MGDVLLFLLVWWLVVAAVVAAVLGWLTTRLGLGLGLRWNVVIAFVGAIVADLSTFVPPFDRLLVDGFIGNFIAPTLGAIVFLAIAESAGRLSGRRQPV